ncbi:MAG: PSD1 and planctomycete cytochrome C domain-containing protein [Verrucomicrobiota bacterium]
MAIVAAIVSPARGQTSNLPADHAQRMAKGLEQFQSQVAPLFNQHCVRCHGGEKTKGDFDLTTREGLLKGGAEGLAIAPFNAKASRLCKLIRHEEEPHMPQKADKLSADAIAIIAAWIDNGAPYDKPLVENSKTKPKSDVTDLDRQFWSFQPLQRTEPPKLKSARHERWCRTPIDRFIMARLEQNGLEPNPPLDRRKLVRRVAFDLTGLPPTPEEVEAFLSDRSSRAYEALIERLLSSPHFGERWARHWLDVSRFAESHGFEHDYDRPHAYHFRDFVIRAFNLDLPYDTFVQWQLAGDELEPDNPLALMATGFLGAGVFPTQITANEVERTRYDALDDMAATMGTAMLGLTVGCARCHDHKFDPIPTQDYYRLVATFTTTVRTEIDLDLDPKIYREAKARFDAEHAPRAAALAEYESKELPIRFEQWLATASNTPPPQGWIALDPSSIQSSGGTIFKRMADGSSLATGPNPDFETVTFTARTFQRNIKALRLEALADDFLPKKGPGRAENGNFALGSLQLVVQPISAKGQSNEIKLVTARATFEQNTNNLAVKSALDADKKTGWAVDPQFGKNHAAIFEFGEPAGFEGGTEMTFKLDFSVNNRHSIGRMRLAIFMGAEPPPLEEPAQPQNASEIFALVRTPGDYRALPPAHQQLVLNWYKPLDAGWRARHESVTSHLQSEPKPKLTKVMICSEGLKPMRHHTQGADFFNETHFLNRGNTDQKKGVATQGFLQVLMRSPEKEKRWLREPPQGWRTSYRRAALAEWITDTEYGAGHLLARVIVNRLWQHHFGQGLVPTPNDFGTQGQRPTHPELLDWLASELIRNDWKLKPMHRLILNSSVYLQDSTIVPDKVKRDPANQWFARREPQRLEAEVIRDALLAVSGTLDRRMFGPGTLDPNHHRRSIYFMVKRSQLIPMMQLFDAPEPLVSVGSRPATTIAPQALHFMNNESVRKAALNFAQRLLPLLDKSVSESVTYAYEIALARPATKVELKESAQFFEAQRAAYAAGGKANANELALADFCQVLLSLNEFVYVP